MARSVTGSDNPMALTGYTDGFSVEQGRTIRCMVSSEVGGYRADIVRLYHANLAARGMPLREEVIETALSGDYDGRAQALHPGSCVEAEDNPAARLAGSFTVHAWVLPTLLARGQQVVLSKWQPDRRAGFALFLDPAAGLSLKVGDGEGGVATVSLGVPPTERQWTFVAASFDAETGRIAICQRPQKLWPGGASVRTNTDGTDLRAVGDHEGAWLIAAEHGEQGRGAFFNGKIARPVVLSRAVAADDLSGLADVAAPSDALAAWDFGDGIGSTRVTDRSPNDLAGAVVNLPMRAVTGPGWTGDATNFALAPDHYDAIHFHDDDLDDAGWEADISFDVPADLPSGIYAFRLAAADLVDRVPFIVRPARGTSGAPLAFLVPTLCYQAYANFDSGVHGLLSIYDRHADGSGAPFASFRQPMLEWRPECPSLEDEAGANFPRHLATDLCFVDWLDRKGIACDVITDHDLVEEGADLLKRYQCVVTGSHPEYPTAGMLDSFADYLESGGRMVYAGGNGFYWVTSLCPERPHMLEVRRASGSRVWVEQPGQYHHATTGEPGGLWRDRNRAPQKLVGVGFASQGWTSTRCGFSRPYRRLPDSFDPRAAFIFDGIGEKEVISDFEGLVLGHGAAGDEIDRLDYDLGTPAHALRLATATGFSRDYLQVVEELSAMTALHVRDDNPLVRADMVFFEYPNDGAVFSIGSMAWFGSLSPHDYDNNVSRITENVLTAFSRKGALPSG